MIELNKLSEEWLAKADDDLQYAEVGFKETDLYANVCFSCQQAFEKYLKASLLIHKVDFPRSHDLTELLSLCLNLDPDFSKFIEAASVITPYNIAARYPDVGDIVFSKGQAEQALGFTKQLKNFMEEKFNRK